MSSITDRLHDMEQELAGDQAGKQIVNLFRSCRAGTRVKRYHTVDTMVGETVGHHSANVAILCVLLSEQKPSANLLMAALTHDLAERGTGDVPATAKWDSPLLAIALKEAEEQYNIKFHKGLTEEEDRVLKQADMLDLCFKALEEIKMGNSEFLPILRRGLGWLRGHNPLVTTSRILRELQHEC